MAQTKILITGGAGFIGSNLCDYFLDKGYFVVCLDNLATGKLVNIEAFLNHENFRYLQGDIRSIEDCREAVKGVDYVFHQAGLGSVPRSIIDPITTNEVNVTGFLNMLTAAKDEKIKRFIYAASSSTYGDSTISPKTEEIIGKPLSPYAITKYVNEMYAAVFSKVYGLETIGLRYFNVFGKKQDPAGAYAAVIPKFIMQLIKYESPVINGDGSISRDFTYIDNVIQMNELAMNTVNPEAINTIYNTAYGNSTSLSDLIKTIQELLVVYDPKIKVVKIGYGQNRVGDIIHSLAAIDKAKKMLGYNPEFSLQQGLKETIKWYWENLQR
jgi:UDP-N-acetylglucosamine/UDP-N-acetylgalactosamine 4-epimerase